MHARAQSAWRKNAIIVWLQNGWFGPKWLRIWATCFCKSKPGAGEAKSQLNMFPNFVNHFKDTKSKRFRASESSYTSRLQKFRITSRLEIQKRKKKTISSQNRSTSHQKSNLGQVEIQSRRESANYPRWICWPPWTGPSWPLDSRRATFQLWVRFELKVK